MANIEKLLKKVYGNDTVDRNTAIRWASRLYCESKPSIFAVADRTLHEVLTICRAVTN